MSKLMVAREKCSQCLYTENRIVPNARTKEIFRDCARKDTHFLCHKGTIAGKDVVCAGCYESRNPGQLVRIMERLNGIEFVDAENLGQNGSFS